MSNLDAVRTERRLTEERNGLSLPRRLSVFGVIALLMIAVVAGLTEIHLLPTFDANDFGSILFGAG